ncbi:MAG TPA: hypothetical protein VFO08_13060 [Methylomirabilota bacterium]|nr:hypothetical protein [Methylomirabilota bacterium]
MRASAGPVTGSWRNSEPSSRAVIGISSVTSIALVAPTDESSRK